MSAMSLREIRLAAYAAGPCPECKGRSWVALPEGMLRLVERAFVEAVERALDLDSGELIEGYASCERCGHPRVLTSYKPKRVNPGR